MLNKPLIKKIVAITIFSASTINGTVNHYTSKNDLFFSKKIIRNKKELKKCKEKVENYKQHTKNFQEKVKERKENAELYQKKLQKKEDERWYKDKINKNWKNDWMGYLKHLKKNIIEQEKEVVKKYKEMEKLCEELAKSLEERMKQYKENELEGAKEIMKHHKEMVKRCEELVENYKKEVKQCKEKITRSTQKQFEKLSHQKIYELLEDFFQNFKGWIKYKENENGGLKKMIILIEKEDITEVKKMIADLKQWTIERQAQILPCLAKNIVQFEMGDLKN